MGVGGFGFNIKNLNLTFSHYPNVELWELVNGDNVSSSEDHVWSSANNAIAVHSALTFRAANRLDRKHKRWIHYLNGGYFYDKLFIYLYCYFLSFSFAIQFAQSSVHFSPSVWTCSLENLWKCLFINIFFNISVRPSGIVH